MTKQADPKRARTKGEPGRRTGSNAPPKAPREEGVLRWNLLPGTEEWATCGKVRIWTTTCDRYRLLRIEPTGESPRFGADHWVPSADHAGGGYWWKFEGPKNGSDVKYYPTLARALQSVEEFHAALFRLTGIVGGNAPEMLGKASELGLCGEKSKKPRADLGGRCDVSNSGDEKEQVMSEVVTSDPVSEPIRVLKLTIKEAKKVLKASGYTMAGDWDNRKLQKKLESLWKLPEADRQTPEDADIAALQAEVLEAGKVGTKIALEGKPAEPKAGKKGKAGKEPGKNGHVAKKQKGEKKAKPKKESDGGSRPKVMDKYKAGPFVRFLGKKGVDKDGAKEILTGLGITHLSDVSIGLELRERREGRPAADVSKDDFSQLKSSYPAAFAKK